MITSKTISKLALLIVVVSTLALTGCSAILGGMGALSDASMPEQNTLSGWQVDTIKPGTAMNLIFKDGSWLRGKYAGLDRIPAEQYAALYSQALEQKPEGIILPALGDSIAIKTNVRLFKATEKKLEGSFEGFEHDCILTKLKGTTVLSDVPLSFITQISSGRGHAISGETIKRLLREGQIPVMSAIVVEGEDGKTRVAMDNVRQIEIPVKKNGASTGFFVGAVIDAAVVVAVVLALQDLDFNIGGIGAE